MAVRYSTTLRTSRAEAIRTAANAGSAPSLLIYSGSVPSTIGSAPAGTLLVTFALNATDVFTGAASNGQLIIQNTPQITGTAATGTAAYALLCSESGYSSAIMSLSVGTAGSGADVILNSTSLNTGDSVAIVGAPTITEGNA